MGRLVAVLAMALVVAVSTAQAQPTARLTIPRLGIINKPIGYGNANLAAGPIFWPGIPGRPGKGQAIALAGHDVTRVPGYGQHGPFHSLDRLRKGDLIKVAWNGEWFTYKVTSLDKASEDDGYIVHRYRPYETLVLTTCWPRYSHESRLVVRAVLLKQ